MFKFSWLNWIGKIFSCNSYRCCMMQKINIQMWDVLRWNVEVNKTVAIPLAQIRIHRYAWHWLKLFWQDFTIFQKDSFTNTRLSVVYKATGVVHAARMKHLCYDFFGRFQVYPITVTNTVNLKSVVRGMHTLTAVWPLSYIAYDLAPLVWVVLCHTS